MRPKYNVYFVVASCKLQSLWWYFKTPALKTCRDSTVAPTLKLQTLYRLVSIISLLWGQQRKKNS